MELPIIGITMGDPTGVGPEVIIKALKNPKVRSTVRCVILGDKNVIVKHSKMFKISLPLVDVTEHSINSFTNKNIGMLKVSNLDPDRLQFGRPDKICGKAMVNYLKTGADLATRGLIDGMVTSPINKEIINEAGIQYPGQTELLADLTHTEDYAMMLAGEKVKVALVTTHCPLREVNMLITPGRVLKTIKLFNTTLIQYFGINEPRIAVAALNPHAGEGGLFGLEEKELIQPAIKRAQTLKLNVDGPFPSDTLFHFVLENKFDGVVCMYHDQGLIPLKMHHFSDAVNITLGLPIVRTSADHGTAYDI
ncbi:MAG TPA: 4-hydroxythreonine-4-phosphate dehydrogenase PdxA, partial [bacterium]